MPDPNPEQLDAVVAEAFKLPVPGKIIVWLALEPDDNTIIDILTGIGSAQTDGGSGLNRINELVATGVLEAKKIDDRPKRFSFSKAGAKAAIEFLEGRVDDYLDAIDSLKDQI